MFRIKKFILDLCFHKQGGCEEDYAIEIIETNEVHMYVLDSINHTIWRYINIAPFDKWLKEWY